MEYFKYILKKIVSQNKGLCTVTFLMIVGFSGMQLYLPVLLQQYIDLMVKQMEARTLLKIAGLYLVISILIYLLGILKDCGSAKIAWRGTDGLRMEIIKKILTYDQGFFQKNAPGQIIESLESDLNEIEYFIENTLIPLLMNLIYMIGILFVFWNTNKYVALLFGVFILAALYTIYVQQKKDSDIILRERQSHSGIIGFESEIIKCRKEIELAGKENPVLNRLEKKILQRIPLKVELQSYYYRVWIITLSLLAGANILSLLVGGILYFRNVITLGLVYLMYSYGNMLKQPFEELQMHIQNFLSVKGSCEKLADLLFYKNMVSDGARKSLDVFSQLELKNVSFCYGEEQILKNIDIKLIKGEKIGIFGPSGAGKSTVSKLISKILEPQSGEVLINGIDIREYSIEALCSAFAYVTADHIVLDANLRDNLRIYNNKVRDEEILNVLEMQEIRNSFSFADGMRGKELLDMDINSHMLSNGEAQMLNLCRLFFVDKELIIFDEASSMVAEEVEGAFFRVLDRLTEHITTVIITHNVERLEDCDYVYMMEQGSIIEAGEVSRLKKKKDSLFSKYTKRSWNE